VEGKAWIKHILARSQQIQEKAIAKEHEILELVNSKP